jgi:hypothetical protein
MKIFLSIIFLISTISLTACTKHGSPHQKIQPAKVDKPSDPKGVAKLTLTPEAKKRLGITSQVFPTDQDGKKTIPVSALLYDTKGGAWVFVETAPNEYHREQILVLSTQGSQIVVKSSFDNSLPIVIEGAAELSGTESGVGK